MPRAGLSREKVLEAAAVLADRRGFDALSLAALAAALGVRSPSLYNHIDSLESLKEALTLRALEEMTAAVRGAAVGRSGKGALLAMAQALREFAKAHPGLYGATLRTLEVRGEALKAAGGELMAVVLAVLRGYGLAGDEAIHATRCLRSALHGFIALELAGGFGMPVDLDESFRWMVEVLERGLRNGAGGRLKLFPTPGP